MQDQKSFSQLLRELEALREKNQEMKRIEQQHLMSRKIIRRVESEKQQYLDIAGVMIVVIGTDERIKLINKKGCEILGYKEEEIVGKNWFDTFIPGEEREQVRRIFRELSKGRIEPVEYAENQILTANGKRRLIAWHNALVMDDSGEVTAALSSGEDITERREVEKKLRESEAKYRDLVDNALVGFYKSNLKGDILYVNDALVDLLGFDSKGEIASANALCVYKDPRDRERLVNLLLEKGKVDKFEFEAITRDGSIKNIMISASLDGDIISGLLIDVTERKHMEEKKDHDNQSKIVQSIGDFAEKVGSDFADFLSVIKEDADKVIEILGDDHPALKHVQAIQMNTSRAASLAAQLQLCHGRHLNDFSLLNIKSIIENNMDAIANILGDDIETVIDIAPEIWGIRGSEEEIELLIMNIALNAKEAMHGAGKLTIKLENVVMSELDSEGFPEARSGRFVCLTVGDDGKDLDSEMITHMLDPYFTPGKGANGVGLGLSVLYGIVKQHGGWLDFRESSDKGQAFKIYLPAADAED